MSNLLKLLINNVMAPSLILLFFYENDIFCQGCLFLFVQKPEQSFSDI